MAKQNPKFEDSDAYVFFKAFEATGDTQLGRHFCKSMKIWNKELLNASRANGQEQE